MDYGEDNYWGHINNMVSGLSTPLGLAGIILIIIGIIMTVIGIILLIANQNRDKGWYIWFLVVGGIVLGIAGGIMLAIALMQQPNEPVILIRQPVVTGFVEQPVITQPMMTTRII